MSLSVADTVYKDLNRRGLDLCEPTVLVIDKDSKPTQSFFSKFEGMFKKNDSIPTSSKISAFPVLSSCILVVENSNVYVFKYWINSQKAQIEAEYIQTHQLPYQIKQIRMCDNKYVKDRTDIPIFIVGQNRIDLYIMDFKEFKLNYKSKISGFRIFAFEVLNEKQIFVVQQNGAYWHYSFSNDTLSKKNNGKIHFKKQTNQIIRKKWIFSDIDEEHKSPITLIYATTIKNSDRMELKIKEMYRTPELLICFEENSDFQLETDSLVYKDNFNIQCVQDYYCLQLPKEVAIMRKKYNKYMILDSMEQRFHDHSLYMNKRAIVTSIGSKTIELSSIKLSDPKSNLRICDVIDIPPALSQIKDNFIEIWPINDGKQYTLIFVFQKGAEIYLSYIMKSEPLEKMIQLANNNVYNLEVVRDMALNLGISHKEFYLSLYSKSKKQNADIYKYLIPCHDIPSIKKQLKFTLRRRTIPVSQMIKILEKMSGILRQTLKIDLNTTNIKQYVKNEFLRRKLKLNQMNKMLDHRNFDKIYSSSLLMTVTELIGEEIDPKQIQIDPLHPVPEQSPYKELKSLQCIFQQFKVILLEDYKDFLIAILKHFPDKILEVLNRYSFLLPNYPFQIAVQKPSKINEPIINVQNQSNIQPLWFQQVTVTEWKAQLTKQKIVSELYESYQTSKIIETTDEFINSIYGKEKKRGTHGLISLSLDEFTDRVKQFQGLRLYLELCQFVNEKALQTNDDPDISLKVLQIFEKKNRLIPPHFDYCVLYSKMHYFMLKNNIIAKQKLNIYELTELKPESLVALFFLENKQKRQFIFRDFMNLYEDPTQFQEVLRKFVQSENCSKIQLEILMKEVIDLGCNFQRQNQEIIEILLIGQCMKLQIRQNPAIIQTEHDNQQPSSLIDDIQISKPLAFKINKIKQLKKCQKIFEKFNCSKMTYEELLAMEQNGNIFKELLYKYFNNELNDADLELQGEIIDLDEPRNMLTVLIYLQETVYYNVKTFDLLIDYGIILIDWKEFQVIKELLEQNQAFQALDVNRQQYVQTLITRALDTIYLDLEIIYDNETKEQIMNVVDLDPDQNSPLKIQQLGKLQLVDIFESWDCSVHPCDIHTICHEWNENHRREFIEDLIEQYIDKLTFQIFEAVYTQLQIIDKRDTNVNVNNEQYVEFCKMYAYKLLIKSRYKQVIEVFTFIKSLANVTINFGLQSEAFLRSICHLYPNDIDLGRKFIEFFIENNQADLDFNIKQLYESYFDETILSLWERQDKIKVNPDFFYKKATGQCFYKLDDLWQLSKKDVETNEQIYYNYYFIVNSMTYPSLGLTRIHGISYDFEKISDMILINIQLFNNLNQEYWIINFDEIVQRFMKGLLGVAMQKLDVSHDIQGTSKLQTILDLLKEKRQQNNELIKSLTRTRTQMKSKLKRTQRKNRFLKLFEEITREQQRLRKLKEEEDEKLQQIEETPRQEIFLTWRVIEKEKKNLTTISQIPLSEQDLINQAFQILGENVSYQPKKQAMKRPNSIFPNVLNMIEESLESIDLVASMIKSEEYDRLQNYSKQLVGKGINKVMKENADTTDLFFILDLMESIKLGDPKKIQIAKLTKYFKGSLSNKEINTLFNYQFLVKQLQADEELNYAGIYEQLNPKIKQILIDISSEGLKDLAHMLGNALQSSEYSALVFYEALLYLCQISQFKSNSAILVHDCITGLGEYPEIVANKYQNLLQCSYKDKQLQIFVKEYLFKLMQEKGYDEIAKTVKSYPQ